MTIFQYYIFFAVMAIPAGAFAVFMAGEVFDNFSGLSDEARAALVVTGAVFWPLATIVYAVAIVAIVGVLLYFCAVSLRDGFRELWQIVSPPKAKVPTARIVEKK